MQSHLGERRAALPGIWSRDAGAGNYIGTNANGDQALSNGGHAQISDGVRLGTDGHDASPEAGRNVISGNLGNGVEVYGQGCVVAGNYIGTDATGAFLLSNGLGSSSGYQGLFVVGTRHRIGTDADGVGDAAEGNVVASISAHDGIYLGGSGIRVAGNYIGTDATGMVGLGSRNGVNLNGNDNIIGVDDQVGPNGENSFPEHARNVVSGNSTGVAIGAGGSADDVIAGNYIGTDATGMHAIPNGTGIGTDAGFRPHGSGSGAIATARPMKRSATSSRATRGGSSFRSESTTPW